MDGQTNQILGLLESRKLAYLRTYFSRYTRQARENVQYIVMDMNAPYFELAKSIFPHAQIVTDRFHIIQHIHRALEGANNKIKVIKRVAYGYRNFLHFRDRIYLIQGLVFQDQSKTKKNQSKRISASIDSR
ncbi:hypothetical protein A5844_002042 [Enterococcus sp. 10A9_DIV0425]|uniref:Transposase IS204/IS1001/IS1096/IS1165 DDE domain-containing protein n=1 Tax=Candidatus Enterococcus wittei TaxID=1987383 RepID=A0A242JYN6_9ENTE|nr:hypothetical protein A5844_002042 [Enterococcus sp. 10A9_DIV0425]